MESYLFYIGKSALAAGAFYLVYLTLFQNQKQFVFNRFYLPVSFVLSFVIPTITFTTIKYVEPANPVNFNFNRFTYLPEATEIIEPQFVYQWYHYLIAIYILGALGFLSYLLLGHIKASKIVKYSRLKQLFGTRVNITPKDVHPFSFFNKIVLSEKTLHNPNLEIIVCHEKIHVKEKHTLDILFAEILFLFQWFNPFAWLLKDAIKNNLEYKTDNQVTQQNNAEAYQLAMVGLADKKGVAPFLTALNGSQLKNRIIMMNKKKENKYALLKQLVILPLLAILVMGLSNREVKTEIVQTPEVTLNQTQEENNVKGKVISRGYETPVEGVGIYNKLGERLASSGSNGEFSFSSEEKKDDIILVKEGFKPQYVEVDLTQKKESIVNATLVIEATVEGQQQIIERIALDYKLRNKHIGPVSNYADEMPAFPGGDRALKKFIYENMIYPEDALENGILGDTYISFIIDKNGKVVESRLSKGVDPSLDKEALRIVNSLPEWIPGKYKGENVSLWYTIPIRFRIKENQRRTTSKTTWQNFEEFKSAENPPLFIVNGKEWENLDNLKQKDIHSVTVLKAESATKIYKEKGKYGALIITKKQTAKERMGLSEPFLDNQSKIQSIKGRVNDENGVPISGVSILIKGKQVGTISDQNGNYEIQLESENETLVFSMKDYKVREVPASGANKIDVQLVADNDAKKSEIVVAGYGTQKDAATIRIKGSGEKQPLYIIDGKIVENIETISPDDIESISVLKDESAVSLYGEKGKNGVILITTKEAVAKKELGKALLIVDGKEYKGDINDIPVNDISSMEVKKNQPDYNIYDGISPAKDVIIINTKTKYNLDKKDPLILLDGKETRQNIKDIDPETIESVNVLKDASAVALYGEKARNGVILIYTKGSEKSRKGEFPIVLNGKMTQLTLNEVDRDLIKNIKRLESEEAIKKYGEKGKNGVFEITSRKVYRERVEVKSTEELAKENEKITTQLSLRKFIAKEIKYPPKANEAGISGTVSVIACVDKNGNIFLGKEPTSPDKTIDEVVVVAYGHKQEIQNAKETDKALYNDLKKEAERVVKSIPNIQIDELKGKTIGITIKFILQE